MGIINTVANKAIATTQTVIDTISLPGESHLFLSVTNDSGSDAFSEMTIKRRCHKSGPWETLADESANYVAPDKPILTVDADPMALAAAASVNITVDVAAAVDVQVLATSSATNASTASIFYCAE